MSAVENVLSPRGLRSVADDWDQNAVILGKSTSPTRNAVPDHEVRPQSCAARHDANHYG